MNETPIEPAFFAKDDPPALWRIGVHMGQMRKIRWQGGVPIHSYAMHRLCRGEACRKGKGCRQDRAAESRGKVAQHCGGPCLGWCSSPGAYAGHRGNSNF